MKRLQITDEDLLDILHSAQEQLERDAVIGCHGEGFLNAGRHYRMRLRHDERFLGFSIEEVDLWKA